MHSRLTFRRHHRWRFATWLIAGALIAGCANRPRLFPKKQETGPNSASAVKATEVQQALMVYVDRFIPALAESCDYIERTAKSPETRAAAQSRKIGGALAAMKNAVNPNPYAGLLDMVVMVTLLSDTADTPATKAIFGPSASRLATTLAAQTKEIWLLAAEFVSDSQLRELRNSIKAWEAANPDLQYVSFVRINEVPETRQIQSNDSRKRPNSVFDLLFLDPLSNLDPAVREFEMSRQLAERGFFYLQRMSIVLAWQVDQMFSQMLAAPEVQATISNVGPFTNSTTRFAQATDDFAGTVEKFRSDIPKLRKDALDQAEEGLARQREVAIRQATTQISAERDAALRQTAALLRNEQQEVAGSLQKVLAESIDRLYRRALQLLGFVFAGVFILCVVFRRWRRGAARVQPEAPNTAA